MRELVDLFFRTLYRVAFRLATLYWCVFRPTVRGANVFVRRGDSILIIRNSYKRRYTVPGGHIGRGEEAWTTAARELAEEVGIFVDDGALRFLGEESNTDRCARDIIALFECILAAKPSIRIDNREVVSARFVPLAEALDLPLEPFVRAYLESLST